MPYIAIVVPRETLLWLNMTILCIHSCTCQARLHNALLSLGQFQSTIDELINWLERTENMLDEAPTIYGDPKIIEIELAKLRVSIHRIRFSSVNLNCAM